VLTFENQEGGQVSGQVDQEDCQVEDQVCFNFKKKMNEIKNMGNPSQFFFDFQCNSSQIMFLLQEKTNEIKNMGNPSQFF